jgi:hypothetical protein
MTSKRLLGLSTLFAVLVFAAPAAAQDAGGGAVATPTAPTAEPSLAAPEPAPAAEPALPAEPAQDQTPTTPGGEEQPPAQQPDGEQAPTEENGGTGNEPSGGAGGGTGAETTGGLPQTGFQLFALTSIGLGLLLAGAALWPTSSWPPPRDRRSRSTTRRQRPPSRHRPARPRTPSSRRSGLA